MYLLHGIIATFVLCALILFNWYKLRFYKIYKLFALSVILLLLTGIGFALAEFSIENFNVYDCGAKESRALGAMIIASILTFTVHRVYKEKTYIVGAQTNRWLVIVGCLLMLVIIAAIAREILT